MGSLPIIHWDPKQFSGITDMLRSLSDTTTLINDNLVALAGLLTTGDLEVKIKSSVLDPVAVLVVDPVP